VNKQNDVNANFLKFPKKHQGRTKRPRGPRVWDPCCKYYPCVTYILKWWAGVISWCFVFWF